MKFLIAGSGAIGSSIGGFLHRCGEEVYFLGRGKHLEAMQKKGLHISGIWGEHHLENLKAFDSVNDLPDIDVVLFTVKSYDTRTMAKLLSERFGEKWVVSLQNGLGNWETIAEFFPEDRIIGGRVIYGAEIVEPGHVKITVIADDTLIGPAFGGRETENFAIKLVDVFKRCGLPFRYEKNIRSYLWAKVLYNNALNPLGAILSSNYGKMADFKPLRDSMLEIIKETYSVGKKLGVKFLIEEPEDYFKHFIEKLIPPTYDHFPSMYHDLHQRGKTEIDALNGAISRYGKELGIPTPVNDLITAMIKFLEKKHEE